MPNLTAEKKGGAGSSSLGEDANSSVSDVMPSTFHTGRPSPVSHDVGENLSRVPSQSPIMVPPSGSAAANGDAVNPSNPNTPFRAHLMPSGASSFYPLQPWKNTPPPYSTAVSSSVAANVVRSAISPDVMKAGVLSDVVSDTSGVHPSLPCLPPSSRSATPSGQFSHERALENFAKTREILKVHMKARSDNNETTPPGDMPVGDSELGHRLVEVVRSAMDAADKLDNVQSPTPSGRRSADDWRDVGDTVTGPSIFFENEVVTDSCNNRVMESIIAKGHAAQTDDELAWLYRNSMLLNLLEKEDLERVVAQSLRREYMKGDIIVSHRETLRHLYTVVWGDVDVFQAEYIDNDQRAMEGAFRVSTATQLVAESTNRGPSNREGADIPELASQQRASEERGCDVTEGDANATYTNVATLLPGQIFGTEALVFDEKSRYLFRAGGTTKKTVMSLIPFDCLREALYRNPRFSQELVTSISGSFDVFGPIREFCRYVFSPTTSQNEYLPIWSIVEGYTRIHNVIHTKLFSKELDTGAWGYALNRLPENVTSTFCFDLVHALPPFVASRMRVEARAADVRKQGNVEDRAGVRTAIKYIRTKERRRCTWQLGMEGKTLVLLRDGFTDLLDFLTMLCTHIVESNKLRGRVQGMVHPPAIDILDEFLRQREEEQVNNASVSAEEELERARGVLRRMPLTSDEQSGLLRNWGSQAPAKIYEVMMHREEFNVRVDPSISRKFQINPFHEWALNLRGCVLEKLKLDRSSALPSDLYVDVVSSNTHCIKNLLSSFIRKYKSEILAYARKSETKRLGRPEEWHNVDDMLYVSVSGFLQNERPDLKEEYTKTLEESGITVLHDTAMTGLQVDVIPVHLLNLETIDEAIRDSVRGYYEQCFYTPGEGRGGKKNGEAPASWAQVCRPVHSPYSRRKSLPSDATSAPSSMRLPRHFIINMDFAFGAQAEGICRAVFSAFGSHIRSVSVMGKAGGMRGKRGDIQLASHVLLSKSSLIMEDNQDELRSCRNQDLFKERLEELAGPKVTVHHGKVLTVTGTMLQNVQLLKYYKRVWGCVGTEMEGSYFARVIEDFYRQGIAHPDLVTRFAYYTSDMPLGQSEAEEEAAATGRSAGAAVTLSAPMTPQEGVPPLYAIARGILENVLLP